MSNPSGPTAPALAAPATLAAVMAFIVALVAGCGDGSTRPSTAVGLYRLVSVNGVPLPAHLSLTGGYVSVTHGDLLLRGDGSFSVGVANAFAYNTGIPEPGQWRLTGTELRLTVPASQPGAAPTEIAGTLEGDSAALVMGQLQVVFRRAPRPRPSVETRRYAVTSLNGAQDLAFEYERGEETFRLFVRHDSIAFRDGVFFRWHRAEGVSRAMPGSEPLVSEKSWIVAGSYEEISGRIVLRAYWPSVYDWPRTADTLQIGTGTLTRHRQVSHPVTSEAMPWVEVYTPVP